MGLRNLLNLYRIQKLYGLIRKGLENPVLFKSSKYWTEVFKAVISIREVREMLKGYKTYIIAILTAVLALLHSLGYIDDSLYQTLLVLLGSGAIGTVAAKINRIQNDVGGRIGYQK